MDGQTLQAAPGSEEPQTSEPWAEDAEVVEEAPDADADDGLSGWAARLRAVPVDPDADRAVPEGAEPLDIPDDVREVARLAPDHWLGVVDPLWDEKKEPPGWAIVGQWRSDPEGEVVEWTDNPDYRPSPAMLEWDDPQDPLDAAIQMAATGYGPGEEVTRVLASAELAVLVDAADAPVTAAAPDGTAVVPVFSSEAHLAKMGAFQRRIVPTSELVGQIPEGHQLYINPTGPVAFVVDHDALLRAIGEEAE